MIMPDPAPGFRDELMAAVAILDPQIDGLEDLAVSSISQPAKAIVVIAHAAKSGRRNLILALLAAMDEVIARFVALKDDGYPDSPATLADGNLVAELQREVDAIAKAMNVFSAAGSLQLDTDHVIHTPQPVPLS